MSSAPDITMDVWRKILSKVATMHVEKATDAAFRRERNARASWLEGRPSAGLRRQHRMSRVACGWVPAVQACDEEESDEGETYDGQVYGQEEAAATWMAH